MARWVEESVQEQAFKLIATAAGDSPLYFGLINKRKRKLSDFFFCFLSPSVAASCQLLSTPDQPPLPVYLARIPMSALLVANFIFFSLTIIEIDIRVCQFSKELPTDELYVPAPCQNQLGEAVAAQEQ